MSSPAVKDKPVRIAILGIYHESNTFVNRPTTASDFLNARWLKGKDILQAYASAHHELGGAIEVFRHQNVELVPVFYAESTPGGSLTEDAYEKLTGTLLTELEKHLPVDACFVVPHGAAVARQHPDMDGDWLELLRQRLGPGIPIVGTLDPHANVSRKMVAVTQGLFPYRSNPHVDQRETGRRAARFLVSVLQGRFSPLQDLWQAPLVISIEKQNTGASPCKDLYRFTASLCQEEQGLFVEPILGFPYADVGEMGSSVIIISNGNPAQIAGIKEQLSNYIKRELYSFAPGVESPDLSLATLQTLPKPVLLLDMGDNVGGGTAGDSVFLLNELAAQPLRCLCCIFDPQAVEVAWRRKPGETFRLVFGRDPRNEEPFKTQASLVGLYDGKFTENKPRHGGQSYYDMGAAAVITTAQGDTVLLHSRRTPPFSLAQITSCNIDPARFDVIIAKGVNAPLAAYKDICPSSIQVNTPGPSQADMTTFQYENRRTPLFPFENPVTSPGEKISISLFPQPYYTEGPVVDQEENIFFTTISAGLICCLNIRGECSVWAQAYGPNGQILLPNGEHLICDSTLSAVIRFDKQGLTFRKEVDRSCAGIPVTIPNDLISDEWGNIYFTDSVRHSGKLFFLGTDGSQKLLAASLDYPNGLVMSKDGKTLYVAESYQNRIIAFDVSRPGELANQRVWIDLPVHSSGIATDNLPDGMKMDADGHLWVAHYGMGMIHQISPAANLVRSIPLPFPLVSNLFIKKNTIIVTGGYGEPGPGVIAKIEIHE